jgi:hypothetical protein
MHGNRMCLTTLTVNLKPFLCNLRIRFDLAQAINRCINRVHIKSLASYPIPTPSVQNNRTSRWGKMSQSLGVSWGVFFPITRTIGTLHRGLVWAVSMVSTVDFQGSLSHSLNFVSVARPRCSGSSRRISTPCLARTHSTNFGGDFQHHLAFPYVHQICRSKRPCARA